MMPSRGLAPLAGSVFRSCHPVKSSSRMLSTAPYARQNLRTRPQYQRPLWQGAAARRQLSWWPLAGPADSQTLAAQAAQTPPTSSPSEAVAAATSSPPTAALSQSTATSPEPSLAATATDAGSTLPHEPATAATATDLNLDPLLSTDVSILDLPEQIGYLKAIGLDYGWGPTATLEYALEHIHIYTGFPWWGSIIVTAVSLRLILFPFYVKASDSAAKQGALQPITKPLNDQVMAATRTRDIVEVQRLRAELNAIHKRAGFSPYSVLLPAITQGILAYCALKLMRGMANLPVPGLTNGGLLWVQDLTVADPFLLLPVIMAGTMHLLFRLGGETGATMMNTPGMKAMMLYVMPAVVFVTMSFFPAGVNLWLSATGLVGIAQTKFLQITSVRQWFGIAPLVKPAAAPAAAGPSGGPVINVKPVSSRSYSGQAQPGPAGSGMRYQAPRVAVPNRPSAQAASPVNAENPATASWVTQQVNALGDSWDRTKTKVTDRVKEYQQGGAPDPKRTRSKEFERQAKEYEARVQQQNKKYKKR